MNVSRVTARALRRKRRQRALVKVDRAHATLIGALVTASKPTDILEFGFGAAESSTAILHALDYNAIPFRYTLVDNWFDWDGRRPRESRVRRFSRIDFVTCDEGAFVRDCQKSYDFIFSDADHLRSQEWFADVFERLLKPGGTLIYHDVTNPGIPNLREIYDKTLERGLRHQLFNRNSRRDERCERGLLVIFKDN